MSEFFVGQKVVCVNAGDVDGRGGRWLPGEELVEGKTYTILCIREVLGWPAFDLIELKRHPYATEYFGIDVAYAAVRFRPIQSKAISIFRKIARDVTEGKKMEIVA